MNGGPRFGRSFLWVENIENGPFAKELMKRYFDNPGLVFVPEEKIG